MNIHPSRSALLSIVLVAASAAHAQKKFDVRHTYDFSLSLPPGAVARTRWAWDDLAKTSAGQSSNAGDVMGGNPFSGKENASRSDATGSASATSEVQFSLAGNHVTGFNHVFGSARANKPPHKTTWRSTATATSTLGFNIGVKDASGRVTWQPGWSVDTVTGSASHWQDPLDLTVTNLETGEILTSTLFSMDLTLSTPGDRPSGSVWDGGFLDLSGVGAADGVLDLTMDSPYLTSGRGTLHLRFANGVVVESEDEGVFDGILPGVGSTDYGHLAIPTSYTMDFDFGGTSDDGFDLGASMGNGGSAEDAVPEPSTLAALALPALALLRRWCPGRSRPDGSV